MKKRNKPDAEEITNDIPTDTPLNMQYTVRTDLNAEHPFETSHYAGDSVNEHKNTEEANSLIADEEIRQQRENL
jgi:hypothetical protein